MFGRKQARRKPSKRSSQKRKAEEIKEGSLRFIEVMATKMSHDLSIFQLKGIMLLRPEHREAAWDLLLIKKQVEHSIGDIYWVQYNVPALAHKAKVELANRLRVKAFQPEERGISP